MIINGRGYICKDCKKELFCEDVTYYGKNADSIRTNCCNSKVVKKNWIDKLRERWKR